MESIYYVVTFLCHRTCRHCYDDRFRPYRGEALRTVLEESISLHPRIIDHFPEQMTYLDPSQIDPVTGKAKEEIGRIVLAGGEVLLEAVREPVLYEVLERLFARYAGRVKLIVQTTGDLLTERILDQLLERHVWQISVSGIDAYHQGLETEEARTRQVETLTRLFESRGMKLDPLLQNPTERGRSLEDRSFHFFGATEERWIGPLWPRGRAWTNGLSKATLEDNFCARWSGAHHFLQYRYKGSEVSVEPNGNVYPCCLKTKRPIGNLVEEPLEQILERLVGHPVYEALSMGHPERMGIQYGWSMEKFLEASTVTLPDGRKYRNYCLGCDAFHEEVLGTEIPLVQLTGRQS